LAATALSLSFASVPLPSPPHNETPKLEPRSSLSGLKGAQERRGRTRWARARHAFGPSRADDARPGSSRQAEHLLPVCCHGSFILFLLPSSLPSVHHFPHQTSSSRAFLFRFHRPASLPGTPIRFSHPLWSGLPIGVLVL